MRSDFSLNHVQARDGPETYVALRHLDASRGALLAICSFFLFVVRPLCSIAFFFLRTIILITYTNILLYYYIIAEWGRGGGGVLPDFLFLFSFPCSADHY